MNAIAFATVAENCAPGVSLDVLEKLVAAESGFRPFAIGLNGAEARSYAPTSATEAAQIAANLIAEGQSIDMGLGQINSANLDWLGLTPVTVFDACRNLAAAETVLRDGYERARADGAGQGEALRLALSSYNTGSFTRGFSNGYVARVLGETEAVQPTAAARPAEPKGDVEQANRWDVFATPASTAAMIFQ